MSKSLSFQLIIGACLCACSPSSFGDTDKPNIVSDKYSARIPGEWKSYKDPNDDNCTIANKPDKQKFQEFTLLICVVASPPSEIATQLGFYNSSGKWFRGGSMDSLPAVLDHNNNEILLYGSASCGITNEAGMHTAGGTCFAAAVFGEYYSVTLETDGTEKDIKVIEEIARSVTLISAGSTDEVQKMLDASISH